MLVTIETEVDERSAEAQAQYIFKFTDMGLPEPDEMVVRQGSLLFLWLEPKTAVIVDLEA